MTFKPLFLQNEKKNSAESYKDIILNLNIAPQSEQFQKGFCQNLSV